MAMKKLSRKAAELCEERHRQFVLELGPEPLEKLVTADESAVNVLTAF
jgi:hypothetical protein